MAQPRANSDRSPVPMTMPPRCELHDFFLYYAVRWGFSPRKVFRLALHALGGDYDRALEILAQLEQNILPEEMMVDDAYNLSLAFHCKIWELFQ